MSNELRVFERSTGWHFQWVPEGNSPLVYWDTEVRGYATETQAWDAAEAGAVWSDDYYGGNLAQAVKQARNA